jgi:hypothetical protein
MAPTAKANSSVTIGAHTCAFEPAVFKFNEHFLIRPHASVTIIHSKGKRKVKF